VSSTLTKKLNIYDYLDYRKYLQDYYAFQKKNHSSFSYRQFSKSAGFKSPNFLKLVMDSQRNLSESGIQKFSNALKLNKNQSEYFYHLVFMNQSNLDHEKEAHYKKLTKIAPHTKRKSLGMEAHRYCSHWIYPVLREMIELKKFEEDPYWIARRLNFQVSIPEIRSALKFLIDEEYIQRSSSNTLEVAEKILTTPDEIASMSYRNYHRQMLHQAEEALNTIPLEDREFGAVTFILPESATQELKERIKKFRKEIHHWAVEQSSTTHGETVTQLNIQLYPHTKNTGTKQND